MASAACARAVTTPPLLLNPLGPPPPSVLLQVLDQMSDGSPDAATQPLSLATLDPAFWAPRSKDIAGGGAPAISAPRLRRIIGACAAADVNQDPGACAVRHQVPNAFLGLWPEFHLLGHSCAPNTAVTVVRDRMLLHATCDLPRGEPLTINRLGSAAAGPLSVRQAAAKSVLPSSAAGGGGGCRCSRCLLEASTSADLQSQLDFMHEWFTTDGAPGLASAMEGDVSQRRDLERLFAEVAEHVLELEKLLDEERLTPPSTTKMTTTTTQQTPPVVLQTETAAGGAAAAASGGGEQGVAAAVAEHSGGGGVVGVVGLPLTDNQRLQLRASAYDCYDLMYTCDELLTAGDPEPASLLDCLSLLRVFAPGSENHVGLGLKLNALLSRKAERLQAALTSKRGATKPGLIRRGERDTERQTGPEPEREREGGENDDLTSLPPALFPVA